MPAVVCIPAIISFLTGEALMTTWRITVPAARVSYSTLKVPVQSLLLTRLALLSPYIISPSPCATASAFLIAVHCANFGAPSPSKTTVATSANPKVTINKKTTLNLENFLTYPKIFFKIICLFIFINIIILYRSVVRYNKSPLFNATSCLSLKQSLFKPKCPR